MAKNKNKRGVNSLRSADKKFLDMLERVGYVSHSAAKELGIKDGRLDDYQYCKRQYIEQGKSVRNPITKQMEQTYRLTKLGKELQRERALNEGRQAEFYRSVSAKHDVGLNRPYMAKSEQEQASWKTEDRVRKMLVDRIREIKKEDKDRGEELQRMYNRGEISPTDAAYTNTQGKLVLVESVTSSYRADRIQAKLEAVELLGAEYEQYKAD